MTNLIQSASQPGAVSRAVDLLQGGGLVGIPTETVYGLAADVRSSRGVARVFAAKGRPADHPLILHVAAKDDLSQWVESFPDYVWDLVTRFWPGPLTLVLPRSRAVPDSVTGGQETVALRSPDHAVAQTLLRELGSGLVAPSANRFGGVSPTSAQAVQTELAGHLQAERDMILDGGNCRLGLESSIIDCTGARPAVLRPGAIGLHDIAPVLPGLSGASTEVPDTAAPAAVPRVPGALAAHYSPRATVRLASTDEIPRLGGDLPANTGLIAPLSVGTPAGWHRLLAPESLAGFAQGLYGALRAADELALAEVVGVCPEPDPRQPLSLAIVDRLTRAAAG